MGGNDPLQPMLSYRKNKEVATLHHLHVLVSRVPIGYFGHGRRAYLLTNATYVFQPYKISEAVTVRFSAFLIREFDDHMRLILRSKWRIGGVEG